MRLRRQHVLRHHLGMLGAVADFPRGRLGVDLIGEQPDRQQDADGAGQTKFVSDAVELHGTEPSIFWAAAAASRAFTELPPQEYRYRTYNPLIWARETTEIVKIRFENAIAPGPLGLR